MSNRDETDCRYCGDEAPPSGVCFPCYREGKR